VVVSGANDLLQPDDLAPLNTLLDNSSIVVLQCETPVPTVERAIEIAASRGATVLLNLAPFRRVNLGRLARQVSYLILNETEATQLTGMPVETISQATQCAAAIRAKGSPCVIITLGSIGCLVADENGTQHIPAHEVATIDTTGAGDAFAGCLAASLAAGYERREAVKRANLYAALSTTRQGAQVSLPTRTELDAAWAQLAG
jgi:ribokinase